MGHRLPPELDLNLVAHIISTAGPASTSFIEVFKAYNDVLQACGLDPADDVVYYRFILKLGSVTGASWGERWARWLADSRDLPSPSSAPSSPTSTSPSLPPPAPAPLPKRLSQSRAAIEEELRREDEERAKQREDERRADVFYNIGLMGRCWDVWRKGREWITTTATQIDRARAFLLLGSTLAHWRKALHHRRSLTLLASQIAARSLLAESVSTWVEAHRARRDTWVRVVDGERRATEGKTWLRWRTKWEGRRKARWEQSLAEREAVVRDRLELRTAKDVLERWRDARHGRTADEHYAQGLLRASFERWRALQAFRARLDGLLAQWEEESREGMLRSAFEAWRSRTVRQEAEHAVGAKVGHRVLREAFGRWQMVAIDYARAKDLSSKARLRTAFAAWRSVLHSHDASRAAADTQRDASLLRSTLSGWRKTLKRNVKEEAMAGVAYDYILKRRAWSFWLQKRARQKQVAWEASRKQALVRQFFDDWRARTHRARELQQIEVVAREKSEQHFLLTFVSHWRFRLATLDELHRAADDHLDRAVVSRAFAKWTAGCVKHGEQLSLMQSFRDVHLESQVKRSFHRWLARAGASKQRKADEHARRERERLDLLRSSFVAWTDKLKEARLRDIETEVVNLHARNLLDNALFLWESRATLAMALHFDKVRRKRAALQRMRAELPRARERNRARKAERERVLRQTFAVWLSKTRAKVASRPPPRLKGISRARPRLSGSGFTDASRRVR